MYPLCSTSPKYNQAVNKQKLFCHVEIHLVSSNVLTGQILSIENFFMSKALAKIKRMRSKPIFICDICCPRVGNDRRRCLLDESLFLFFFFSFFFFYYDWGRNWRERFPKTDGYQWLAHTRIDNWSFEERIVWQPRRGLGLFYWEKDKKIQHDLETEITIIVISKLAPNLSTWSRDRNNDYRYF